MSDAAYAPAGAKRAPRKRLEDVAVQSEPLITQATLQTQVQAEADPIGKRIEEMRALRRDRKPMDISGFTQKLSVPEDLKDKRLVYRWVNDTSTRHYDMLQKGWIYADSEVIAKDERNSGTGSRIERIANERTTPKPQKTFLMVKPREFYEEDKAAEAAKIKAHEQTIVADATRGQVRTEQGSESGMYIPAGGMKIDSGR